MDAVGFCSACEHMNEEVAVMLIEKLPDHFVTLNTKDVPGTKKSLSQLFISDIFGMQAGLPRSVTKHCQVPYNIYARVRFSFSKRSFWMQTGFNLHALSKTSRLSVNSSRRYLAILRR
jgi:hypothetical protein